MSAFHRLLRLGFPRPTARRLALAGFDVVYVPVDVFLGGER